MENMEKTIDYDIGKIAEFIETNMDDETVIVIEVAERKEEAYGR